MTTIQTLIDSINSLVTVLEFFAGLAFIVSMLVIALKHDSFTIYFISAMATFFIGISLAKINTGISYTLMALSTYEFLKGIENLFVDDKPSQGWSRFKGIYNRITGRFKKQD